MPDRATTYKYIYKIPALKRLGRLTLLIVCQFPCVSSPPAEHVQDKMIARDEDLSDSEDEGDGRRNESVGHHDNKRMRLADEGGENKPPAVSKITTGPSYSMGPIVLFLL